MLLDIYKYLLCEFDMAWRSINFTETFIHYFIPQVLQYFHPFSVFPILFIFVLQTYHILSVLYTNKNARVTLKVLSLCHSLTGWYAQSGRSAADGYASGEWRDSPNSFSGAKASTFGSSGASSRRASHLFDGDKHLFSFFKKTWICLGQRWREMLKV